MKVIELFDSIQGEGIYAGLPMTFIRMAGCNLHCSWCDTKYAQEDRPLSINPKKMNVDKEWVCITGGEPLLQAKELLELLEILKGEGHKIEIETNGSAPPPIWAFRMMGSRPMIDSWVVDIKLPSSGNPSSEDMIRRWLERECDQIKFVLGDPTDAMIMLDFWMPIVGEGKPDKIVSPVMPSTQEWMQEVAKICVGHDLRMSLQLHKIIWGNKKGV